LKIICFKSFEGGGGVGGKGGGGGRGKKWTQPCMHIWIIKEKGKKKKQRTDGTNKKSNMKKKIFQSECCSLEFVNFSFSS
jgi:hypothetical protein